MHVVIDLTSLDDNFSGIERFALSISKELIKNSDNVYTLLFKNKIHEQFEEYQSNVKKIIIKGGNKLIFNQLKLPYYLVKLKADYYLFLAFPAPFLFFRKTAISAIHDMGAWDCVSTNKFYMSLYFRILYRKAAWGRKRIVTVSHFSKDRISKLLNKSEKEIMVIYNGLAEGLRNYKTDGLMQEQVGQKYNLPDNYILCLSTLEPRKNLCLLLSAYDELLQESKIDCKLVLAGRKGWKVDNLLKDISEKAVKNIIFTGFIEEKDLPYIYSGAELFVFPSIYEGFGVPPIEAMSVGTIVISSDSSSLPEILGNSAIYFSNNKKNELKKRIIEFFALKEIQKEEMRKVGKEHARKYSWEKSAGELEKNLRGTL